MKINPNISIKWKILIITSCISIFVTQAYSQCEDSQSVSIDDLRIKRLHTIIENAENNDLADLSQGVCGINIEFEHSFLGDVSMWLNSPGGDSIFLIGPIGEFGQTGFTNWEVIFLPCTTPVSPDDGFNNTWSNDQNWGLFGNFEGSYYPQIGCLEDLDMGPVNGIWTLTVEDELMFNDGEILSFELIFCDETGMDCRQCNSNGGVLNATDTLSFCLNDPALNINLLPFLDGEPPDTSSYSYVYTYSTDDTVRGFQATPDFIDFPVGEYQICGVSYLVDSVFDADEFLVGLADDELFTETNRPNPMHCISRSENCIVIQISTLPELNTSDIDFDNCTDSVYLVAGVTPQSSQLSWLSPASVFYEGDSLLLTAIPGQWRLIASNNACVDSSFFEVTVQGIIPEALILLPDTLSCQVNEVNLVLETNIEEPDLLWSGPDNYEAEGFEVIASEPGLYQVAVEFFDGCVLLADANLESIQEFPGYEIFADSANCLSSQVIATIISEDLGLSFSWKGPEDFESSDSSVVIQNPGTYFVEITNVEGCLVRDSIHAIFDLNIPAVDSLLIDTLNCEFPDVIIGVFSQGDNLMYNWTGPGGFESQLAFPTVSQPGLYMLNLRNSDNCELDTFVNIIRLEEFPLLVPRNDTLTCSRPEVQLTVETENIYTSVTWTGPNGFISNDFSPAVYSAGSYNLEFESSDGCVAFADVLITSDTSRPMVQLTDGNLPCDERTFVLDADSQDPNLSIQWSGPSGFTSNILTPEVDMPGTYHIRAESRNGCLFADSLQIYDEPVLPMYNLMFDTITCERDSGHIFVEILDPYESIQWEGPGGFQAESPSLVISSEGVYRFQIIGENGCLAVDSIEMFGDTLRPDISFMPFDPLICEVMTTQLHIEISSMGPDYQYQWTTADGDIFSGENTSAPLISNPGTYILSVINTNNSCSTIDSILVTSQDSALTGIDFSTSDQSCLDANDGRFFVDELVGPTTVFELSLNGGPYIQVDSLDNLSAGNYLLTVRDSFGCVLDTAFSIQQGSVFDIILADEYFVDLGDTLTVNPGIINDDGSTLELEWDIQGIPFQTSGTSVFFMPAEDMPFGVLATNGRGCTDYEESFIRVEISEDYYAPNVFAPLSEFENNLFRIIPGPSVSLIEDIHIYDRWGNLVYHRENILPDQNYGWDGSFQGKILQPAVFVYIAKFVLFNGEKREIKGSVTLLR